MHTVFTSRYFKHKRHSDLSSITKAEIFIAFIGVVEKKTRHFHVNQAFDRIPPDPPTGSRPTGTRMSAFGTPNRLQLQNNLLLKIFLRRLTVLNLDLILSTCFCQKMHLLINTLCASFISDLMMFIWYSPGNSAMLSLFIYRVGLSLNTEHFRLLYKK